MDSRPRRNIGDQVGKEATGWRGEEEEGPRAGTPLELYPLRTTLKTWCWKTLNEQWQANWKQETKGKATRRHTPKPTKKVLQLHSDLNRSESALLVEMRTEKIGLKDFLFSRRVPGVPDPRCDCRTTNRGPCPAVLPQVQGHPERGTRPLSGTKQPPSYPELTQLSHHMEQTRILLGYRIEGE
jgi:delta 1-pyrroline-5-carboxylate dehydrogenase